MLDNLLKFLEDKKILILGFGKEGKSSFHLIRRHFKEKQIYIADKNEQLEEVVLKEEEKYNKNLDKIELISGEHYLKNLDQYDIILKTPRNLFERY